jgi:hypothetical protein
LHNNMYVFVIILSANLHIYFDMGKKMLKM